MAADFAVFFRLFAKLTICAARMNEIPCGGHGYFVLRPGIAKQLKRRQEGEIPNRFWKPGGPPESRAIKSPCHSEIFETIPQNGLAARGFN
ncbi:MAG TPA: hypothetical protein VKT76_06275 [Bradyrhizobium sp.]|nr:hypothetical protein [Bradyrhizobium sp.]